MTENNMAEAQAHAAPILTLHSEAEAKLQVEQAVEKLDELKSALRTELDLICRP